MHANDDSLLTVEAIAKMTDVWKLAKDDPDTIFFSLHIKDILYPHGMYFSQVGKTYRYRDYSFTEVGTKYPSVAAILKKANLTPEQYDRYQEMLDRAEFIIGCEISKAKHLACRDDENDSSWTNLIPTAIETVNMSFVKSHKKEIDDFMDARGKVLRRIR